MRLRLIAASGAAVLATAASAQPYSHHPLRHYHHHFSRAYAPPPGYGEPPAYVDRAPGWEVRRLAERAQHEPGVTSELAPDARQTATGGPSGGVPGFSGGM